MATFGSWLKAQDDRNDAVGELARYWGNLGITRMNSPTSIRRHLQMRGDLNEGSEVAGWLDATEREYRNGRAGLKAVPDNPDAEVLRQINDRLARIELLLRGIDPDYVPGELHEIEGSTWQAESGTVTIIPAGQEARIELRYEGSDADDVSQPVDWEAVAASAVFEDEE